jgi:purine-binding chemotaxis protein CheW
VSPESAKQEVERRLKRLNDKTEHTLARLEALEGLVQELMTHALVPPAASAQPQSAPQARSARSSPQAGGYLVLRVEGRRFALRLDSVREVVRMAALRPIPRAGLAQVGLLDLRGEVLPVISLRAAFGVPDLDDDLDSRIVIVRQAERSYGLKVDAVDTVIQLEVGQLDALAEDAGADLLVGTAALEDGVVLILDVEGLVERLASGEVGDLGSLGEDEEDAEVTDSTRTGTP